MPTAKLDHAFVSAAQCQPGKKKTDWYDTTITGFVLECRCSGGRTYYLRYEDQGGRQKQHKIGCFEDISFTAARKRAQELRSEVVLGGDPGAKKAQAKAIPLYRELAEFHLGDAKLHQRSYSTTAMYMRRHILPKWGKMRLTEIDTRAVAQWLSDKRSEGLAPATVEKIRAIFGRSFELGAREGLPGSDKNPTRGVPRKPLNNACQRFLTAQEKSKANAFNVGLYTDLTILSLLLPAIALLIARERRPEVVGWFCDRDRMTSWCEGVIWDIALENFRGLSAQLGIDTGGKDPVIGVPDRSSGQERMWFDHFIRPADWFAGTMAAWDWKTNQLHGDHPKYMQMVEEVCADSTNAVILPVLLDRQGSQVTRLVVSRKSPDEASAPTNGEAVPSV